MSSAKPSFADPLLSFQDMHINHIHRQDTTHVELEKHEEPKHISSEEVVRTLKGTEYIQPRERSGIVSELVQVYENKISRGKGTDNYIQERTRSTGPQPTYHEYENHQGIEYIQDRMRSTGPQKVLPTYHEYENYQGIEYIQDRMRSTGPQKVLPTYHEYESHQGIEYIQDRMRSTGPQKVLPTYEYKNQQGMEYIREPERSSNDNEPLDVLPTHEHKLQEGIEYIRREASTYAAARTQISEQQQ